MCKAGRDIRLASTDIVCWTFSGFYFVKKNVEKRALDLSSLKDPNKVY